jgi:hypothetical protein
LYKCGCVGVNMGYIVLWIDIDHVY